LAYESDGLYRERIGEKRETLPDAKRWASTFWRKLAWLAKLAFKAGSAKSIYMNQPRPACIESERKGG
jgi:hypothetical protein